MDLAVIIPAYKATYLDEALKSLANQTNKHFTVYVGDDCSPYDILSVCRKYAQQLRLNYHRFETNLGGTDLVKQWERCVTLTKDEQWIWVFSDDDIAEETCVESFYNAIEKTSRHYDVYRFNTCVINAQGTITSAAAESPTVENAMDLAINILLGKRGNSMPDHIFKKEKYTELNGFVDFAYAQSSDWATSIAYAYEKGLYTISGPKVRWRYSGENVSSQAAKNKALMLGGYMQFLQWITQKFGPSDEQKFGRKHDEVVQASMKNFISLVKYHYHGIPYKRILEVAGQLSAIYKMSYLSAVMLCFRLNLKVGARALRDLPEEKVKQTRIPSTGARSV